MRPPEAGRWSFNEKYWIVYFSFEGVDFISKSTNLIQAAYGSYRKMKGTASQANKNRQQHKHDRQTEIEITVNNASSVLVQQLHYI